MAGSEIITVILVIDFERGSIATHAWSRYCPVSNQENELMLALHSQTRRAEKGLDT